MLSTRQENTRNLQSTNSELQQYKKFLTLHSQHPCPKLSLASGMFQNDMPLSMAPSFSKRNTTLVLADHHYPFWSARPGTRNTRRRVQKQDSQDVQGSLPHKMSSFSCRIIRVPRIKTSHFPTSGKAIGFIVCCQGVMPLLETKHTCSRISSYSSPIIPFPSPIPSLGAAIMIVSKLIGYECTDSISCNC